MDIHKGAYMGEKPQLRRDATNLLSPSLTQGEYIASAKNISFPSQYQERRQSPSTRMTHCVLEYSMFGGPKPVQRDFKRWNLQAASTTHKVADRVTTYIADPPVPGNSGTHTFAANPLYLMEIPLPKDSEDASQSDVKHNGVDSGDVEKEHDTKASESKDDSKSSSSDDDEFRISDGDDVYRAKVEGELLAVFFTFDSDDVDE